MDIGLGFLSLLPSDALLRALTVLDHVTFCRLQCAHPALTDWGQNQYVWQALYHAERRRRCVLTAPTDWRCAFRQLRPAWDEPLLNPQGDLCWQVLAQQEQVPESVGGQDPKLFDIGQERLLVLAGARYAERRGGINIRQSTDAYLLDISSAGSDCSDCGGPNWRPITVTGTAPPFMNGCFAGTFGDGVVADQLVTFAGGTHTNIHDVVSALDLTQLPDCVTWHRLEPEPGPSPGSRYAGASAVWDGALIVLCGRTYGDFFGGDELWLLRDPTTSRPSWQLMVTNGEGPSPRVWLAALVIGDSLIVYGGAEWTFDASCWGNDSPGAVWSCDLLTATWSCVRPQQASLPQCRVGAITTLCGKHLFVHGGTDLARRTYLTDTWLYDFSACSWMHVDAEHAALVEPRSHGSALAIPRKHSVVVFGGSQYLRGKYFRDVLVLKQVRRKCSEQLFLPGTVVEAHSLSRADLNGARGRVKGMQEDRVQVDFGDPHGGKALKPANLKIIKAAAGGSAGRRTGSCAVA